MPVSDTVTEKTIFPTRDSIEDVITEGTTMLPITTSNTLVALLQLYHNTLLQQLQGEE